MKIPLNSYWLRVAWNVEYKVEQVTKDKVVARRLGSDKRTTLPPDKFLLEFIPREC